MSCYDIHHSIFIYLFCTLQSAATVKSESEYYHVGHLVDAKSLFDGTWWEGKIIKIVPNPKANNKPSQEDDGFFYHVQFDT